MYYARFCQKVVIIHSCGVHTPPVMEGPFNHIFGLGGAQLSVFVLYGSVISNSEVCVHTEVPSPWHTNIFNQALLLEKGLSVRYLESAC